MSWNQNWNQARGPASGGAREPLGLPGSPPLNGRITVGAPAENRPAGGPSPAIPQSSFLNALRSLFTGAG